MKWFPIILIGFGVGFLLYNLQIVSFTPWSILWPVLIICFAADQLVKIMRRERGAQNSWDIVLWLIVLTIGVYNLLPIIGLPMPSIPWKVVWPLALILVGFIILFPGKSSIIKFEFEPGGEQHSGEFKHSFVGDYTRGPGNWVLDDTQVRQGVGTVNLDLTQAIIPDREVHIDIVGYVGEASIYLPPGLPFKAECSLKVGDITLLDQKQSGTPRYVQYQSPDYDSATQKVHLTIHWKIGEISVRQIR